jgi:hypothetical protein
MRRKERSADEPVLRDSDDCLHEIARCAGEIRRLDQEYGNWIAENPGGSWPGAAGMIGYWRDRKARAEARFDELNKR